MLKIILAGGRAKRMGKEKAILKINGITLVERVFNACEEAFVAVSRHTPETRSYCLSKGFPVIQTPGMGYVEDVRWLFEEYGEFISLACDIPFLRRDDVKEIEREIKKEIKTSNEGEVGSGVKTKIEVNVKDGFFRYRLPKYPDNSSKSRHSSNSKKPSLIGCIRLERTPKGAGSVIFEGRCLVGINTVTLGIERFFEFSNPLLAFNVNSPFDYFLANSLAKLVEDERFH